MIPKEKRRWIMFCRKAIRLSKRHSYVALHDMWVKTDSFYEANQNRDRDHKFHNKEFLISMAMVAHNGGIGPDGIFTRIPKNLQPYSR